MNHVVIDSVNGSDMDRVNDNANGNGLTSRSTTEVSLILIWVVRSHRVDGQWLVLDCGRWR